MFQYVAYEFQQSICFFQKCIQIGKKDIPDGHVT